VVPGQEEEGGGRKRSTRRRKEKEEVEEEEGEKEDNSSTKRRRRTQLLRINYYIHVLWSGAGIWNNPHLPVQRQTREGLQA